MTYEELSNAQEEKVWLVARPDGHASRRYDAPWLVRADSFHMSVGMFWVLSPSGVVELAPEELCIATPNDMLKYGE